MHIKINSYAGVSAVAIFVIMFSLAVINFPGYDPFRNYISDLGVGETSSPYFNLAAVVAGALGLFFSRGLQGRMPYVFALASMGLMGVGIFHSKLETLHLVSAGIFFVMSSATMFLAYIEFRKNKSLSYIFLFSGLMPLVFIATFLPIIEHIAVAGILVSIILLSIKK